MKRVLLIAYHFPPMGVSSGIQRTLKFAQYLPEFDWYPSILTAHPRAYQRVRDDQLGEIPTDIIVARAFALDTSRHLAIRGIHPRLLALPDRWISWWPGAVLTGLSLIRRQRPAVIWSTYPIATAHLIGLTLHRLTNIPWVADFRDQMVEVDCYPSEKKQRQCYQWIERQAVSRCDRAVFTTPGTLRMYAERYPAIPSSHWVLIANGYDEGNFTRAEGNITTTNRKDRPLLLVHSGVLYPDERDPRPFFTALSDLKRHGMINAGKLKIVLRASGSEQYHNCHIEANGIQDIVSLEPSIPYEAALREMLEADGLLLFQASNCNNQIPAKLYEYMRAKRPIFALTDHVGDTASLLLSSGIDTIVPLNDQEQIAVGLKDFLTRIRQGKAPIVEQAVIVSHSRHARTRELANLFDEVVGR